MSKKNKKYYIAPDIDIVKLDVSVSMILEPTGNPNGGQGAAFPAQHDSPVFGSFPSASPASSPFGGSRPDYGDM